jgi:hypothetical protein
VFVVVPTRRRPSLVTERSDAPVEEATLNGLSAVDVDD